jgi:hypothetical protein
MSVILKIKCNCTGEVHRMLLEAEHLNYDSVIEVIGRTHGGSNIIVKYVDADEDLCTLCHSSFTDFLSYATQQNGKELLKVEVFEVGPNSEPLDLEASAFPAKQTAPDKGEGYLLENAEASSMDFEENPLADMLEMGAETKGFGKGGFWKRSIKFKLAQLYKNGLLDSNSFSALFLTQLPPLMTLIAENPEKASSQLDAMLQTTPSLFEALHTLVTGTEGIQQCQVLVETWRNQQMTASEALLQLIPALMALPFEAQHAFAKTLYLLTEDFLRAEVESFVASHPWMPTIPLVHDGIACDGCHSAPIAGIRLKCTVRPNYDLCTTCFAKQDCLPADRMEPHGFEAVVLPRGGAPWWVALKGKGKGKGLFAGKGKGKGKWLAMTKGVGPQSIFAGKGKGKGKWWAMMKGAGGHMPHWPRLASA